MQNTIDDTKGQFSTFIGVELLKAMPMTRGNACIDGYIKEDVNNLKEEKDDLGYVVDDGICKTWRTKEHFDNAYFPIADETKISASDVMSFIVQGEGTKLGDKTTVVLDSTITGFDMVGTSACVDPNNYSQEIGEEIARRDITNKIWGHLGFVLQWAKNGLKYKANS